MGEGEGSAQPLIGAWLAGLAQMAAAMAATVEVLAAQGAESEAADALWSTLDAQFGLWRAHSRGLAAGARTPVARETLERFLDPAQWLFGGGMAPEPALVAIISGPDPSSSLAFGREALRTSPAWAELRRARSAHRALVAGAWKRCLERVARDPVATASVEALLDRWVETAGAELDALQQGEPFLASMRRLVMAAVALREAEARLVEAFCEAHALPTRREVDDLHRTVTDLRRELRALRRAHGDT
jgi:hypothetical protein